MESAHPTTITRILADEAVHGIMLEEPAHEEIELPRKPEHEEIAINAYLLWEDGGYPPDSAESDWLLAEEMLIAAEPNAEATAWGALHDTTWPKPAA